eukprot:g5173.t1
MPSLVPGQARTSYKPWVGGNLRDHTLFGHDGELYAFCTTGWGNDAAGPGDFVIIKRKKRSGQWVFHSRIFVPHTLQADPATQTSVIWSPIPWHFGPDQVAVFLSSTCTSCQAQQQPIEANKTWHRSSVIVHLNDQLTQAIAQADLSVDAPETSPVALGGRPQSRYISYQPFERLDGGLGIILKDEAWSEVNRTTGVPNRIVLGDFERNVVTRRLAYFDSLTISGMLLMVEAHTVFPEIRENKNGEKTTEGYRFFYSVFAVRPVSNAGGGAGGAGGVGSGQQGGDSSSSPPRARTTRTVWASADFSTWANDTEVVADGQTLGLVTVVDEDLLPYSPSTTV